MNVLHIASSPRGERSLSLRLAGAFLDALASRQSLDLDEMDVWNMELLPFDGPALAAKYADLTGDEMTADQTAVWQQIADLGQRFHAADVLLFSVPMWNFGVPYRLKHLIDVVSQRGVLFDFDAEGMRGLLTGKQMVVCATRGVALGPDFPESDYDHQVAYLCTWARMVGIRDVKVVLSEATLGGEEIAKANEAAATQRAVAVAASI